MKVSIIGTGYVGLVGGAGLASTGNEVTCLDKDVNKIERLNAGERVIYEEGLDDIILKTMKDGNLKFTSNPNEIVGSDVTFICVGTPLSEQGFDMSQVNYAANMIRELGHDQIVALKSTVRVGTTRQLQENLDPSAEKLIFVSAPEFLKEGGAVGDFLKPDRVIIGTDHEDKVGSTFRDLFRPFLVSGKPLRVMSPPSAESAKILANSYLAMRITYINEAARFCDAVGADIGDVRLGIGDDQRIGGHYLYPGIGYGGMCFPKDVEELTFFIDQHGVNAPLLSHISGSNETQREYLVDKILKAYGGTIGSGTFGIWGLAFKARSDDVRESPIIDVIDGLIERGAKIRAYDPEANGTAREYFDRRKDIKDRIRIVPKRYDAVQGANALVVGTEWSEFRSPDLEKLRRELRQPVIFDGRNLYDPESMREAGFGYYCIGRPDVIPSWKLKIKTDEKDN